ncbi:MAG: hypothetical protein KDA60_14215, partial [Planctomycetales bacterium]|nr:hypothetical protein [Planctomycetales bacterium]
MNPYLTKYVTSLYVSTLLCGVGYQVVAELGHHGFRAHGQMAPDQAALAEPASDGNGNVPRVDVSNLFTVPAGFQVELFAGDE